MTEFSTKQAPKTAKILKGKKKRKNIKHLIFNKIQGYHKITASITKLKKEKSEKLDNNRALLSPKAKQGIVLVLKYCKYERRETNKLHHQS